ncbi:unnamed protein product [Zymoseptoria tritici ST99CH_3D1]|uniref:Sulfite oxidase n=2 Tax=Zymoseptoria tritici TaxID=1047171 RepID=F9XHD9_ZYMTI|nr:uncharacterized protein MYCGRDRAFT_45968 [Zymoseptoria tritici IPO323]EGP85168.1 hypothetical protein MYCGRDRAFT_45968 [Zymoseptoria tritici IPO323]SMR57312.1 unnamed protein product [Zymoseptoria tritici ST99CH_1E4]SMR60182.1 unnamed protein product [Zymoseptoria tritici ST99CH_3D1]
MTGVPDKPLNREPSPPELISQFFTPSSSAYDRNHSAVPELDASTHVVKVDGNVSKTLSLSVKDLKENFTQHEVVCALQCAGNRRHTMRTKIKEVNGLDWFDGAVMNCKWRGPRLRDVLERAGVDADSSNSHVAFASYQVECQDDTWYGGSISLKRALDPASEVLVALEMNGEPLSHEHGHPVRMIVPGVAGARSVKWLDRITVQSTESQNHYQLYDYKVLPPEATDAEEAKKFWDRTPAVQDMPVNSIVGSPPSECTVTRDADGTVVVTGYALPSGDDGPVVKVEVSADGGHHWTKAVVIDHPESSKWSWALWKARVSVEAGSDKTILSRATDAGGNMQPEQSQWNLRGVCYNGYGAAERLKVL